MRLTKKIFILNAIFVAVISAALIAVISFTGRDIVRNDVKGTLASVVRNAAEQLKHGLFDEDGQFDGVYLTYFNDEGKYYAGYKLIENESLPDGGLTEFNGAQPQPEDVDAAPADVVPPDGGMDNRGRDGLIVRQNKINGVDYFVCEVVAQNASNQTFFIRGLMPTSGGNSFNTVLLIFILSMVVIMLVALALSYVSLKKATEPIRKITGELNKVENSADLSKRIDVDTKEEEIKKLVNAYNRMLDRVQDMMEEQERFTSDVSHELRSPLTVLLSESEFALNDLKTAEDKDKSLEAIYTQTKRLTVMVRQLLDFTRVAGTDSVKLADTDISVLTQDIAEAFVNEKGITFHCEIESGIVAKTDETLYIRMVTNLIDNAVKYGKEGGNVWVKLSSSGGIALEVKDDGIGMNKETVSHIYERMYQADKSRSGGSGLGLGMSFVKEISRILKCNVYIDSALGEGSTFTVRFMQ